MPVIEYKNAGETLFTHTSWFSERQINAWKNIPAENKNLALYYGLATTFALGVVKVDVYIVWKKVYGPTAKKLCDLAARCWCSQFSYKRSLVRCFQSPIGERA